MNGYDQDTSPALQGADRDTPSLLERLRRTELGRRVREFRVEVHDNGLVLRGRTDSYYVKQLAQHAAMALTNLPVLANEISVKGFGRGVSRTEGGTWSGRTRPAKPLVTLATGDEGMLATVRAGLAENGCAVATAAGGVECLSLLREFTPDVLILDEDLLWGGADGILAHIQARHAAIPVILLTTPANDTHRPVRPPVPPVVTVVGKPVSPKALVTAVRSATAPAAPAAPAGSIASKDRLR